MPIELKTNKPVPIAQTPEFKKLQDLIDTAKVSLDNVARQIVEVESKLIPTATDALGAPQPDPSSAPMPSIDPAISGPVSSPGIRGRLGFEEAIEDMRRIAGLR
jgi:hypothetical protein